MSFLIENLYVIILAWCAGLLTGLIPGIGVGTLLLSFYFLLSTLDILQLFIFYVILITTAQYYGQISAIIYGVPGEITAMPAVQYGHPVYLHGQGSQLLSAAASSSLIGGSIAIIFFYLLSNNLTILLMFFDNTFKTFYLTLAVLIIIFLTENKLLTFLLAVFGFIIGLVGYNSLMSMHFLTPKSSMLDSGIPFLSIFLGFYIIPNLYYYWKIQETTIETNMSYNLLSLKTRIRYLFSGKKFFSMIRGSLFGSLIGLIPGASYAISSSVSANIEQKICKNKKFIDKNFSSVVSAEAANNAGSITVLIPLIFLALPIIPSEAIIFSLAEQKGFGFSTSFDFIEKFKHHLIILIIIFNIFNWVLAGYYYTLISFLYVKIRKLIYPILILILICLFAFISYYNNQILLSTITFVISFAIGMLIKNNNESKTAFIFCFFLADIIFAEYLRFYILNT